MGTLGLLDEQERGQELVCGTE